MRIPFFRSLRFKIGFGYIVLVVINVAATAWAIYNFGRLSEALNSILGENYPNIMTVENMASSIEHHESAISSILNKDIVNGKAKFTDAKNEFFQWFHRANDSHTIPDAGPIFEDIRSTYNGYLIVTDSLITLDPVNVEAAPPTYNVRLALVWMVISALQFTSPFT